MTRLLPALLALALALAAPAVPAQQDGAQQDGAQFRAAPQGTGGKRLVPTCRVTGIISNGVINMVNPKAEADRRSEKVRGFASRVVTLPVSETFVTVMIEARAPSPELAEPRLAASRDAVLAAIAGAGLKVVEARWTPPRPLALAPADDAGGRPVEQAITLSLAGDADPLALLAALPANPPGDLPDGAVTRLGRLSYKTATAEAAAGAFGAELEAKATDDARTRAGAIAATLGKAGEGLALGHRIAFEITGPDARRLAEPGQSRRIEITAIATYELSRPPGSSLFAAE